MPDVKVDLRLTETSATSWIRRLLNRYVLSKVSSGILGEEDTGLKLRKFLVVRRSMSRGCEKHYKSELRLILTASKGE